MKDVFIPHFLYCLDLLCVLLLSGAGDCSQVVPVQLVGWLHLAQSSVGNYIMLKAEWQ